MIPFKTVEELILKHASLEKELSSGEIDKKLFAEKSKEYSDVNEIIDTAKKYISFQNEKVELEHILISVIVSIKNCSSSSLNKSLASLTIFPGTITRISSANPFV